MPAKPTLALVLAAAWLLFAPPALAQDGVADPLAYTPTGHALWDVFAQAVLEQLATGSIEGDLFRSLPTALPVELLDGWEGKFGDDPEYWQLRYWSAVWREGVHGESEVDPIAYLEQASARGAADAVTEMLLYQHRRDAFEELWDGFAEGTLNDDERRQLPEFPENISPYSWFVERRLKLADDLVAACPGESWAWYERAMTRFEYGAWEDGLADLSTGNNAPNNRLPLPFPLSYVVHRVAAEQHCGSEVCAGSVLMGTYDWIDARFGEVKDQARNQEVRLNCGAPLRELQPWHHYTCRFGSMEGAPWVQWLLALVLRNILIKHLLVETPELFTVEQRDALWRLNTLAQIIKELWDFELHCVQPDEQLEASLRSICEKRGVSDEATSLLISESRFPDVDRATGVELLAAYCR